MEHVYIDDIKVKNCRNHHEMEMDFPVDCFTVIQGKNGAGKSTIIKSLSMGLMGDDGSPAGDKVGIADMVNRKVGKNLEILINFHIVTEKGNTDRYEVQLYHSHSKYQNKMFLLKNTIDISGKTKADTYKILEGLLYPKDVYHNVVCFNQQVKNFFTSLTNTEQKKIFDSILQTKIYNTYYENARNGEKKVISLREELELELRGLEYERTSKLSYIGMLENAKKEFETDKHLKIQATQTSIAQTEQLIKDLTIVLNTINFSNDEYMKLSNDIAVLDQQLSRMDDDKNKKLEEYDTQCTSEFNVIQSNISNRKQVELDEYRKQLDSKSSLLLSNRTVLYEQISAISSKYDLQAISADCSEFEKSKQSEQQQISYDINSASTEFSTSTLEFERDERLAIIERNIQDIKDSASDLKGEAANIKSVIESKQEQVNKDKDSISGDIPSCSKCKRPFTDESNIQVIKDSIEKGEFEIVELGNNLTIMQTKMETLKSEFEEASSVKLKAQSDYNDRINDIVHKRNNRIEELQRKQTLLNQEVEEYRKQSDIKLNAMKTKIESETSDIRTNISKIDSDVTILDEEKKIKLQTINSTYDKETQNTKLEHIKKYSDLKNSHIIKCEEEQKNETLKKETKTKNLSEMNDLHIKYTETSESITNQNISLKQLNTSLIDLNNSKYVETDKDNQEELLKEIEVKIQAKQSDDSILQDDLEKIKFWKIAFSDSGIKSMLIDMAIPHMNIAVAEALDKTAPGVFTVSFDTLSTTKGGDIRDKFNVNILHNIEGTDNHKMLSGGEKRIVDLACMDALRSLSEKLYNKKIHITLYDEVLDSLDEDNRQVFCQVSKILSKDQSVFLITHGLAEDMEPDRIFKL
jgi:DNA repair exonuclease SbcCD ATPase subunit